MLPGETVQSILPQDLPWWRPDFAFFSGFFTWYCLLWHLFWELLS